MLIQTTTVKAEIELARIEIEKIDREGLHPLLNSYIKITKTKLDQVYNALDKIATMSRLLPNLLGYPQAKTFLFLLENGKSLFRGGRSIFQSYCGLHYGPYSIT